MLTATKGTGANAETTKYTYKYNNLLETVTTMFGTPDARTLTYGYDENKNVDSVEDYFGTVTSYTHDGLNRLKTVTRNNAPVASYDYYQFGALEKITYPGQGTSEFSYDNALRLTGQTNKLADDTSVNTYGFVYDKNGSQTRKTDNGMVTKYEYDALGRLADVYEQYEAQGETHTAYKFDEQSNISVKTVKYPSSYELAFKKNGADYTVSNVATHEFTYAYDANNRLKFEGEYIGGSSDTFTGFLEFEKFSEYDNNGNLKKTETSGKINKDAGQIDGSMVEYEYNALNQLTKFTAADGVVTDYAYNPDGMRRSKTTGGVMTNFYWDRGYISNESVNGTSTPSATNLIGVGGILGRVEGGNTSLMLKNGYGDVTSLVSDGAVTKAYDYDAYGVEKNIDRNDTNPFRYSGEYTDLETNLIYLRARYYDPATSRMLSEDPARQGTNWYIYCNNNPLKYVDPSGLAYVQLRLAVEANEASLRWDADSNTAFVTMNGITKGYSRIAANDSANATTFLDSTNNKLWVQDTIFYANHGMAVPDYSNLSSDAKELVATVASEAIGENSASRRAVTNVIINRTSGGKTVKSVVSAPYQFSGYGDKNFNGLMNYMNNRTYDNAMYEALITQAMDVYYGKEYDITGGSTLFYSPKSMNPPGSAPNWDFRKLEEAYVDPSISKNSFKFYRYR